MRYAAAALLLVSLVLCAAPVHADSRKDKRDFQKDREHRDYFLYEDWNLRRHLHGDYEAVRRDMAQELARHGVIVDWRDYGVTSLAKMLSAARHPGLYD